MKSLLPVLFALALPFASFAENKMIPLYLYDVDNNPLGTYTDVVRLELADSQLQIVCSNGETAAVPLATLDYFAFSQNGLHNTTALTSVSSHAPRYMIRGNEVRIVADEPIRSISAWSLSGELVAHLIPNSEEAILNAQGHSVLLVCVETPGKVSTLKIVR